MVKMFGANAVYAAWRVLYGKLEGSWQRKADIVSSLVSDNPSIMEVCAAGRKANLW